MVLSNAERQARHRERLKARADAVSDAQAPSLLALISAYLAEPGRLEEWDFKDVPPDVAAKAWLAEVVSNRAALIIDAVAEDSTPAALALSAFLNRLRSQT